MNSYPVTRLTGLPVDWVIEHSCGLQVTSLEFLKNGKGWIYPTRLFFCHSHEACTRENG